MTMTGMAASARRQRASSDSASQQGMLRCVNWRRAGVKPCNLHVAFIFEARIVDSMGPHESRYPLHRTLGRPDMITPRLPWWQRLVQPSVVRRLALAQMLLLQLWGAMIW